MSLNINTVELVKNVGRFDLFRTLIKYKYAMTWPQHMSINCLLEQYILFI
jgi:hypothetical protein